jgi:hypothetical protein
MELWVIDHDCSRVDQNNTRGFEERIIHFKAMLESHPIYGVAIPLDHNLLNRRWEHASNVPLRIIDAAMCGEGATGLVVVIPTAMVTHYLGILSSRAGGTLVWEE